MVQLGRVIARKTESEWIRTALKRSRVVALLGPRQSGKTTLDQSFVPAGSLNDFDLEDPASLAHLTEPELASRAPSPSTNLPCAVTSTC